MTWRNDWPTLSGPVEGAKLRVLSLGAGVQSTTRALAAARGDVGPMPDCAIFADTGWEPRKVMAHLNQLQDRLPFPVHIVSVGSLREAATNPTKNEHLYAVPFHTRMPDGQIGLGKRQCTRNYKITPIARKVRELLGVSRPKPNMVEQWIGISLDEVWRMKPARVQYVKHRWPLIEAGMTRQHCVRWMEERQEKAPRSACRNCPFLSNAEHRDRRDNDPEEWALTIADDHAIRALGRTKGAEQFTHKSCLPLEKAPIDDPEDGNFSLFDMECEGMCGV